MVKPLYVLLVNRKPHLEHYGLLSAWGDGRASEWAKQTPTRTHPSRTFYLTIGACGADRSIKVTFLFSGNAISA